MQNEWFKGRWSDELDFAILEEEWQAMRHEDCLFDLGDASGITK